MDLNNDKLTDVIKTNSTDYYVWLNLKDGRWSNAFVSSSPDSQATFDRSYIRLADMNGDRLQDIVWLEDDLCLYYPNKGFGEFEATPVTMENPPFASGDESRLIMADVNGDGMSDVLHVGTSRVRVWLNLGLYSTDHSKGRFADFFTISPPIQ